MNSYSICRGCFSPLLVIILICWTKAVSKFSTPGRKIERGSKHLIGYDRCQLRFGSYTENSRLNYLVIINYEPADLTEHENHPDLDRDLLEGYAGMEQGHTTPTNLRVHCENGHWFGERVTSTVAGSTYLVAISTCDKCQGPICMICKKHLEKDASLATIVDHDCKANLAADEKIRQQAFEGQERGKDYQVCPV